MRKNLKSTAETMRNRGSSFSIREDGAVKKQWRGRLKICLVYPNTYYVGMSNLGLHAVYSLWNDIDEVVCERAFLSENGETPRSFESGRELTEFDVIAFTVSFENDYIHFLRILSQIGLPLKSSDRHDHHPLVIMGGAAISMNPCPVAPFVDCFVFGDGEEVVADLATTMRATPFLRHDKKRILEYLLAEVSGIFVPALQGYFPEQPIKRRGLKFINSFLTKTEIVSNFTEFSDVFLVEVSRGCPQKCRFCSVSYTETSTRFRRLSFLKSAFDEGIERVGRVGLLGAALSDHPELLDFADYIVSRGGEVSLSSLRVEAVGPKLIELLVHSKQKTLTLALETGSQRLQEVIHKRTQLDTLSHVVTTALDAGVKNLKFYFIIGLPTEQTEDILQLADLIKRVHREFLAKSKSLGHIGTLTVSLNPFIPKPTTPFEACAHVRVEELERRFRLIMTELEGLQRLQINHEGWDTAILQSVLSVGDVDASEFLLATHNDGDNWRKQVPRFQSLIEKTIYTPKTLSHVLPWSFITR